jgi:ketosteroid isomerase-like protein
MIAPLLLLLASAAEPGRAAKAGLAARAAVRRADAERCAALGARDQDRFVFLLADDTVVFPDQAPPVEGKAAVRTFWAPFFDAKGPTLSCEPVTVEVAASGDLAYTLGKYSMKGVPAERSPTRGHGKYVTIWRKRNGGWKVAVDIGNGSPPPERDFGPPPPP